MNKKEYCYGFYPDSETFYSWENFQDMLFDGRLHGEEVEIVRATKVLHSNTDFIVPYEIGESIISQADDTGGECAEEYIDEVSAFFDHNDDKVREILSQLLEQANIRPTFFSGEDEEIVTVIVGNRDESHIKAS